MDYKIGTQLCYDNANRLETSARIILKNEDGTDSFALFLMYMAYEEMAKSLFCTFVNKKWISEEFIEPVFRIHDFKIFLYDEIFRSFSVKDGVGYLGGEKLGTITLRDFQKQHEKNIKIHTAKKLALLYVGKSDSEWNFPKVDIPEIDSEIKLIKKKIEGLATLYMMFNGDYKIPEGQMDEFHVFEKDGVFSLRFRIQTKRT